MDCCSPRSSEKDRQTGKPSLRAPQNVLKCHDIVTKYLWVAETCLRSKAETETQGRDDIVSGEGGKCTAENKGERQGERNLECAEHGRQVAQPFLDTRTESCQLFNLAIFSHSGASISLSSAA